MIGFRIMTTFGLTLLGVILIALGVLWGGSNGSAWNACVPVGAIVYVVGIVVPHGYNKDQYGNEMVRR